MTGSAESGIDEVIDGIYAVAIEPERLDELM